jgi:23S rRNA (uracil1939-C5)-methyltransferase
VSTSESTIPQIEPGTRVTLSLEAMGPLGECAATLEGSPVSVFGGIPGERVEAEIVRRYRDHLAARVVAVLEPSPHRVAAPCPYFWPCTGCQWQHISYEHQLELKRLMVLEALARVSGLDDVTVLPTMPSPQQLGYRNHARFTIGPQGALGFVSSVTRRFVGVEACQLMDPGINETLAKLQGHCAETTQLSVRRGVNTGEELIQPKLVAAGLHLETGQKSLHETLAGRRFRISSPSFFQVNTPAAEALFRRLRDGLRLSGEDLLVDAYAGVGTLAALFAPMVRRVIAIEESSAAVRDAEANLADLPNVEMRRGRTEDILADLDQTPDVVVLDPSRTGCHPRTIAALVRLRPRRIGYVSCDADSLARDLALLTQRTFRVEEVQPVDLFPQTHHIECIALLSLVEEEARVHQPPALVLASTSPRRRQLLADLGLSLALEEPEVDESISQEDQPPEAIAQELALRKAMAVAARRGHGLVIGADTVVALDGRILGKPTSPDQARQMLGDLRGRSHRVITGVALVEAASGRQAVEHSVTTVTMRDYTDAEIEAFVASGEAMDKAGAYAVQDQVFRPSARVEGCYANVIGLPLCMLADMLAQFDVTLRARDGWSPPGPCPRCTALGTEDGGVP